MKFYIETNITIKLDTDTDLSTASNPEIHYRKPNGSTGEWTGTISGQNIEYSTSTSDIDEVGSWGFQAVCTFGSDVVKGEIVNQYFNNPIKLT